MLRIDGLAKWFEIASSPEEEQQITTTAREFGIGLDVIGAAQHRARRTRDKEAAKQWTGGNSEYATFLRRWARDRKIPMNALTSQQETQARNAFFAAGRANGGTSTPDEDRRFPLGVENYLANMKGRGYSRADAEAEVFRADVWQKLQAAHPRISATTVQQAIARLFPDDLPGTTADGAAIFDTTPAGSAGARGGRGGAPPPPPPPPQGPRGGGGVIAVQTPDGQTFTFPNQRAADEFKRAAGIR